MSKRQRTVARRYDDPEYRARHRQATRNALAIPWTEAEDAKLTSLYLAGAPWLLIEREMDYTHTTCLRRVRELGIYRPRKPGPMPGSKRAGRNPIPTYPPS
jgi:hypothetical protein